MSSVVFQKLLQLQRQLLWLLQHLILGLLQSVRRLKLPLQHLQCRHLQVVQQMIQCLLSALLLTLISFLRLQDKIL